MTHNRDEAEDLRVRRTRKLIQDAFLALTIEKGFTAVTVGDIAERAMVNRSTFYRHYLDKFDLLDQFAEEVYAITSTQETEPAPGDSGSKAAGQPPAGLVNLFKHVQAHADFYRVMFSSKGDPTFTEKARQYIERRFRQFLPPGQDRTDPKRPPLDLCVSYVSHAGIGVLVWWLENNQPCPPEQLAVWVNQFSQADVNVALGPG